MLLGFEMVMSSGIMQGQWILWMPMTLKCLLLQLDVVNWLGWDAYIPFLKAILFLLSSGVQGVLFSLGR